MPFQRGVSGNPAGKRKGTRNKVRSPKVKTPLEKAIDEGVTPLDYMISVLQNKNSTQGERMDAAKAAAPYVHARLAHQTYSGPGGGNIVVEIVRYLEIAGPAPADKAAQPVAAEALPAPPLALP